MVLSPPCIVHCENYDSERIKKSPRWDDEGVAATVGTIMTLLVFLTFMGVFTNQFVPVWMSDNESTHMSQVIEQITTLKSNVDGLVADYSNSLMAPTPIVVPVTLGSAGIPVFAVPTTGILSLSPETMTGRPSVNITFSDDLVANDGHTGGNLKLQCPNRYYVEQSIVYEGGVVIINQTDGEFIIAGMQLSVVEHSGSKVLKMTQVSLVGKNITVGGTGSKAVNADLLYASTMEYTSPVGEDVVITITTKHGYAWANYFKKALNSTQADLVYGVDFTVPNPVKYDFEGTANDYYIVTVTIADVSVFDHTRASVQVSIGELGV